MPETNNQKLENLDYLEYLRGKGEWTDKEKLLWEYLSTIVNLLSYFTKKNPEQKLPDLDYLEYLRGKGKWTDKEKLFWNYLSVIINLLYPIEENPDQKEKPDLTAQYRPYHPPDKGIRKGPPPIIL